MTDRFSGRVESISEVHPEIRVIRIRTHDSHPSWRAGQYMDIAFAGLTPRPYSIASAPHNDTLEFHIRTNQRGGASDHAVNTLKPGDEVELRGPYGTAARIAEDRLPLLLIAGGMGLPPMKSILEDALRHAPQVPVTLYWGVKSAEELYLLDDLRALALRHENFRFIPVIEEEGDGLVSDMASKDLQDLSSTRIYLSGPSAMITALVPLLLGKGADPALIHGDDDVALRAGHAVLSRSTAG